MTIEASLNTLMDTVLTAIGQTSINLYPGTAPVSANYPFITYELITDRRDRFANYSANSDMTLQQCRIELQLWTTTASDRATIEADLRDELHGYRGTSGDHAWRSCFIDGISHFSENDLTGTDDQIYRAVIPLDITYT